jgi:hypothetical protein
MLGRKRAPDAIKEPMRKISLAAIVAVLPTWVAVAQESSQPPKKSPKSSTLHPVRNNPCAQYGVGFAKLAGSDTCVKIGDPTFYFSRRGDRAVSKFREVVRLP